MTIPWRSPAGLHPNAARLPGLGELPSLCGGTGWLTSPQLDPAGLRGRVELVSFWTYTCINWRRQLPYLRAWAGKYAGHGLTVIGVHTPEFGFEHQAELVRWAVGDMKVEYPVAIDSDYAIWTAFDNHYWPAPYFADASGQLRHSYFGEGEYAQSEMIIQQLLADAGQSGASLDLVSPGAHGLEAAATVAEAGGQISFRFRARDLHLVMSPGQGKGGSQFRVRLDGQQPGAAHGTDTDAQGRGTLAEPRLYQLIRQRGPVVDRTVEITFDEPGAQAYAFTFG